MAVAVRHLDHSDQHMVRVALQLRSPEDFRRVYCERQKQQQQQQQESMALLAHQGMEDAGDRHRGRLEQLGEGVELLRPARNLGVSSNRYPSKESIFGAGQVLLAETAASMSVPESPPAVPELVGAIFSAEELDSLPGGPLAKMHFVASQLATRLTPEQLLAVEALLFESPSLHLPPNFTLVDVCTISCSSLDPHTLNFFHTFLPSLCRPQVSRWPRTAWLCRSFFNAPMLSFLVPVQPQTACL